MNQSLFVSSHSNTSHRIERNQRITYAAISGFAAGTVCALVASFINILLYPDLPLYMEWSGVLLLWSLWAGISGVLAGVSAISSEGWTSILLAAFLMAAAILIVNFVQGMNSLFLNLLVLLGLSIPFTAMMSPLAYIFFWLARRFVQVHDAQGWGRWKVLILNALVILVLGALPGLYSKFDDRAERGLTIVNGILQESARAAAPEAYSVSLRRTEGFSEHHAEPFTLSQSPSVYSTVGVDVTAHYEDGYTLRCTVVLYPGQEPYLSPCKGILP